MKKKKAIFVCQVSEEVLRVVKTSANGRKMECVGLEVGKPQDLKQIFQKLEYNHDPIIVSLPRSQATCRYLKIPSVITSEIERIASLQAPRYLPYPANELITGYQVISTDKEGHAYINLVIVHRDLIERYIKIFKEFKPIKFSIVLSSYGLTNLYSHINPQDTGPVMLIDADANQVELVILSNKKMAFSRAFKINPAQTSWENSFIAEINKSQDVYSKDVAGPLPVKIAIFGGNKVSTESAEILNKGMNLPTEVIDYSQKPADYSFASLFGLGIAGIEESVNLLPAGLKEESKKISRRKENLRLITSLAIILCIFGLGVARHLDNKSKYLERLKVELNKISKDAEPLEEMQKRFEFMQSRSQKKLSSMDILYEIHQNIPAQVSLVNLNYEEEKQVILRGQTQELNSVFGFVAQLEKSSIFKKFNIKVRYATKKRTATGEVIDFEIVCLRK